MESYGADGCRFFFFFFFFSFAGSYGQSGLQEKVCCPLQLWSPAMQFGMHRGLLRPDGLPEIFKGGTRLEDVLCRLIFSATSTEVRENQLELFGHMVVESVVPTAESQ